IRAITLAGEEVRVVPTPVDPSTAPSPEAYRLAVAMSVLRAVEAKVPVTPRRATLRRPGAPRLAAEGEVRREEFRQLADRYEQARERLEAEFNRYGLRPADGADAVAGILASKDLLHAAAGAGAAAAFGGNSARARIESVVSGVAFGTRRSGMSVIDQGVAAR